MARFTVGLTQGGADTSASTTIDTGLTVDGKVGVEIYAMEMYWTNGETAAAGDIEAFGAITTTSTAPAAASFISPDEIGRISWGLQNTGGVAVAVPYEPIKQTLFLERRVTVQPLLYFHVVTSATGQANQMYVRVFYDIVKLTDLEVMRLLVGGA